MDRVNQLIEERLGDGRHQIENGEQSIIASCMWCLLDEDPTLTDKELWRKGLSLAAYSINRNLRERFKEVRSLKKK